MPPAEMGIACLLVGLDGGYGWHAACSGCGDALAASAETILIL